MKFKYQDLIPTDTDVDKAELVEDINRETIFILTREIFAESNEEQASTSSEINTKRKE